MSSPHPPPSMAAIDPASPTAADLFEQDDLEFRTITTLLHTLGSRERITVENFQLSHQQRPRLKLLSALSSLLVRDHEILAVMPKRSARGMTLFVGSEGAEAAHPDIRDDESTSSWSSSSSHENFITRNPRYSDPAGPVELLDSPSVEVGSDIFGFIVRNWDLSFASHVQAFANLLNTSLNAPDDHKARVALDMYSVFQSAPKIRRRLNRSPRLRELAVLQPRFHVALTPSSMDKIRIRAVLLTNNGVKLHPSLYGFLRDPTTDPHRWLPEFHRFFKWFLAIVDGEIKQLQELRSGELAPLALPETVVDHAFNNLAVMRYFSWESVFFASYIRAAFEAEVESTEEIPSPEQMAVRQMEEEEEDAGFDISTEFETGEDQASAAVTQPAIHPCILELRLITSNIQHLNTLLQRSPKSSFRFQVIQYARSDDTLKPWQELISELFPSKDLESDVLQALRNAPGKKFNTFRPGGPVLKFKGQAHCEAVLGCLYSLSKRSEDITWTGIPKSLLNAISTCYSLLAPSKRCCPVCANTISLLSIEAADAGGPYIHALSKHSITFPCAFPIGLPRSVRGKLLELYRRELRERLTDLLALERKLSGRSTQSATLSLDGDAEAAAAERENWALLRMYQSGWAELQPEERRERWAEATADLEMEQLVAWWAEMEMETKLGLVPPATGGS